MKTLVLVGGGHAHIEVLRRFALVAEPDLDLVLVNPGRWAAYSGMLPGLVAGFYAFEECHVDLAWLAARAGARLLAQRVIRMDAGARVLDLDILQTLVAVRREAFVPTAYQALAFVDTEIPLPQGENMLSPKLEARL